MVSPEKFLRPNEGETELREGREPKSYRVSEAVFFLLVIASLVGVPAWVLYYDAGRAVSAGGEKVLNVVARNDKDHPGEWLFRPAGNWSYARTGTLDDIRVREGEEVTLRLTSIDVEHEFSLPEYDIKAKVKPGKVTVVHFRARKAGKFKFECTSYCRDGHDKMTGQLVVDASTGRGGNLGPMGKMDSEKPFRVDGVKGDHHHGHGAASHGHGGEEVFEAHPVADGPHSYGGGR